MTDKDTENKMKKTYHMESGSGEVAGSRKEIKAERSTKRERKRERKKNERK